MNRFSHFAFSALVCISTLACAHSAQAKGQTEVSKDAVLAACRHTSGCSYGTDTNTGETSGCSPNACFYCKTTTCHQVPAMATSSGLKPKKFDAQVTVKSNNQISQGNSNLTQSQGVSGLAGKSLNSNKVGMQNSLN